MQSNQNADMVTPYKLLAASVIKQAVHEFRRTLVREALGTNRTGEKVYGVRRESSDELWRFIINMKSPFHRCLDLDEDAYHAMAGKAQSDAQIEIDGMCNKKRYTERGWGKKKPPEPK